MSWKRFLRLEHIPESVHTLMRELFRLATSINSLLHSTEKK